MKDGKGNDGVNDLPDGYAWVNPGASLMDRSASRSDHQEPMDFDLLVNEEAWNRAGEELRRRDPHRYMAILRVVEDICRIYRDPYCERAASGTFVFPKKKHGPAD